MVMMMLVEVRGQNSSDTDDREGDNHGLWEQ